jgi:hypothetical protein
MEIVWRPETLNRLVAPGIGSFRTATIPDLRPEFPQANQWLTNHFLSNALRAPFKPPHKQYALNFIYRTYVAFSAYHVARDATLRYLATGGPGHPDIRLYYDALSAWESTLLNWAVCLRIVKAMRQENLFQTGDGSSEERAYLLQNAAKHWGEGSDFSKDQTVPIWLADAGISSGTATLAYDELGDLIRDLAKLSNEVQDPVAFKQGGAAASSGQ